MALTFSEGSIGGDIETVNLDAARGVLRQDAAASRRAAERRRTASSSRRGSNGIAIAPSNTAAHHALLLINPHTSFFFRSELQMASDEGLNAYGALTWGQFFIYQGFNERAGWMHTSSGVDDIDEYLETVTKKGDGFVYKYGAEERPVDDAARSPCRTRPPTGMAQKEFTVYRTHHGPIVREAERQVGQRPADAGAAQGAARSRTRAPRRRTTRRSARRWSCTPTRRTTRSSPTPTATSPTSTRNFIPKRDPKFDWTKPVDGSDPATEWNGVLSIDETPQPAESGERLALQHEQLAVVGGRAEQPEEGGLSRRTSTTDRARARAASTRCACSTNKKDFTLDSLIAAAYDSYLPAFDELIPRAAQGVRRARRRRIR